MKTTTLLNNNWYIKDFEHSTVLIEKIMAEEVSEEADWISTSIPNVVQEILFEKGKLSKEVLETGVADYCAWVSERDWAYQCSFEASPVKYPIYLEFKGLDTVVDIYLNGNCICKHVSMFLSEKIEVTRFLESKNMLLLYFHSPQKTIKILEQNIPGRYQGKVKASALLRKSHGDFSSHGGAVPYFTPIGVYDDISIIFTDTCEIDHSDIEIRINQDLSSADLMIRLETGGIIENVIPEFTLSDPSNHEIYKKNGESREWQILPENKSAYNFKVAINNPLLWWPKNYGEQPLYTLKISLRSTDGSAEYDHETKIIGFRKVENVGDMKFRINGKLIKLWGSNITPMWGVSHQWQRERGYKLLDYAAKGNMNALRLWGPSQPYHDEFYEQCNRLGILIWQEFHTWGTHMPDLEEYRNSVLKEAGGMIRRLKHHPCIFMWCGGNEQIYMADLFDNKAKERFGHDIIHYDLKNLVASLDPYRYYHISSPSLGQYANEAVFGDTHGSWASRSFLPGETHAHFFSEDIRTSIPELKSLKRFIKPEELWPEGYRDIRPYGVTRPLPDTWMQRTMNRMEHKTGPYELFYDAIDPESLVYKINAAAAYDDRLRINRLRQGKPFYNSMASRSCNGYLIWKLNTAWPQIYCALIDYYLEPGQTYYATRRAYVPLHVSIDLQDHVYVWGTNDTLKDFVGSLCIEIYDIENDNLTHKMTYPAGIPTGDSIILKNLDDIGQFRLYSVIHAVLFDASGNLIDEDFQYVRPERRLIFPEAKISLEKIDEKVLRISADRFARCVELSGDYNGNSFGWHFEDNYFDLMPGQIRTINWFGEYTNGSIFAKAHYSPFITTLKL